MGKLANIVAGVVIPLLFASSGCQITIGGRDYIDLNKSRHVADYNLEAEEFDEKLKNPNLGKSKRESLLGDAICIHGGLGNLDIMDKYVGELIDLNFSLGEIYDRVSEKYHKLHKR